MSVATLKTRRILLDAVIDPCLCNLVICSETTADGWELHIWAACPSCQKMALEIVHKALGKLPPVTFED